MFHPEVPELCCAMCRCLLTVSFKLLFSKQTVGKIENESSSGLPFGIIIFLISPNWNTDVSPFVQFSSSHIFPYLQSTIHYQLSIFPTLPFHPLSEFLRCSLCLLIPSPLPFFFLSCPYLCSCSNLLLAS